jgi:hypothetical protein
MRRGVSEEPQSHIIIRTAAIQQRAPQNCLCSRCTPHPQKENNPHIPPRAAQEMQPSISKQTTVQSGLLTYKVIPEKIFDHLSLLLMPCSVLPLPSLGLSFLSTPTARMKKDIQSINQSINPSSHFPPLLLLFS